MRRVALLVVGLFAWVALCCGSACSDSSSTDPADAGSSCDDRAISCRGGSRVNLACSPSACGTLAAYCYVTHAPSASQVPAGCVDLTGNDGTAGCPPNATGPTACTEIYCCPEVDVDVDAGDASDDASDASDTFDAADSSDASDASDAGDAPSD